MKEQTGNAGGLTRYVPTLAKILDWFRTAREQIFTASRLQLEKPRHVAVNWHSDRLWLSIHLLTLYPDAGRACLHMSPLDAQERTFP
jgi:hypothetical protein